MYVDVMCRVHEWTDPIDTGSERVYSPSTRDSRAYVGVCKVVADQSQDWKLMVKERTSLLSRVSVGPDIRYLVRGTEASGETERSNLSWTTDLNCCLCLKLQVKTRILE